MRKIKTINAPDVALDWLVAKIEEVPIQPPCRVNNGQAPMCVYLSSSGVRYSPTSDWAVGGPIIEREEISTNKRVGQSYWWAGSRDAKHTAVNPTPLLAAMCCYVASKLGDEVEVPEELL